MFTKIWECDQDKRWRSFDSRANSTLLHFSASRRITSLRMTAIQTTCQLQFICTEYNYSINHKNRHMMHKSEFYEVQTFCLLKKSKDHRLKLWNHQSMNFRAKCFFFRLLFPIKIFSSISYCVKCKHLQYFGIYSSPGTKLHMAKTFVWNMWCIRFLNWFWIDMSHRRGLS